MAIPENGEKSIDGENKIKREASSTQEETLADNSNKDVIVRSGYKTDHPPEDDCCPICFDSFQFPCRTNCGHWYCGSCFLQHWRHTNEMNWCKCPMCGCEVQKLIPYSSKLIPSGEDGRQILNDIRAYNYQYVRRWFAYFLEMLTMVRRLPEDAENRRRALFCRTYYGISLIVSLAINILRFGSIPYWLGVIMLKPFVCFQVICAPLIIFFEFDDLWFRRRRRARRLAQLLELDDDDDDDE